MSKSSRSGHSFSQAAEVMDASITLAACEKLRP